MKKRETLKFADIMHEEAHRGLDALRASQNKPKIFYISHLLRDEESWKVEARFGSVFGERKRQERHCFTDVRVGSYTRDHVQEGGLRDNSKDDESYGYIELPCSSAPDGLRYALWRLTDARYREAVEGFLRKQADELTYLDRAQDLPSFEKRAASHDIDWQAAPQIDKPYWTKYVQRASALLKKEPLIKVSSVQLEVSYSTRIFASTEGSKLVQAQTAWSLECYLWLLSEKGDGIPWTIHHHVVDPKELPSEKEFTAEIRARVRLLRELAKAPTVRSFSGPVLLSPKPAGLLIHEALGHRLEGNRLLARGEGQTFRDSVGKDILPKFLSLRDDPTLTHFEGKSLVGHYTFDDEGVTAQDTRLIDAGRLKSFLTSRAGIKKRHHSNGHGRSGYHQRPMSRMGVTLLTAEGGLTEADLKARLLEEIRRQKVPFGIRIFQADSGETATEGYDFQAFLGEISLAARVFPDGREEWIRGVNFVGTPLNAVRSIVAAGLKYEVDNAHCGAESGYIPVSTISPSLLLSRLELQSKGESAFAPYTYALPWE